jgi:crotonobetainyl-CoA hydratase
MTDGVLTVKDGAVLEITIDRPKANAIDLKASLRLNQIVTSFRDDPELRIAIITGAGERFFSPGWDLKAATAGEESDSEWGVGGFAGLNYPRNLNKPIIAAVNGIACGGGFEIVLGTDIIVMEEHAKFALPEINVGVLADAGTVKLRRRIPYHVAVEFLLTGRWMDAAEAKHWGLANHIVPKGQAMTKAREIAQQLVAGPPLLFPAIKQLLRHTEMVPEHEAFELHDSLDAVQRVIRSDDLKEGTRAFSEKRKPRWTDLGKVQSLRPAYPPLTRRTVFVPIREAVVVKLRAHVFGRPVGERIRLQQCQDSWASFKQAPHQARHPGAVPDAAESGEPHLPVEPRLMRNVPSGGSVQGARFVAKHIFTPAFSVHRTLDHDLGPGDGHHGEQSIGIDDEQWRHGARERTEDRQIASRDDLPHPVDADRHHQQRKYRCGHGCAARRRPRPNVRR